jgi:hypothetical protein
VIRLAAFYLSLSQAEVELFAVATRLYPNVTQIIIDGWPCVDKLSSSGNNIFRS